MQSFAEQLATYQQYHMQKKTKLTHAIAIPLITFALMIFCGWIHIAVPNLFEINLAWPVVIAVIIYYFTLDSLLAAGLTVMLLLFTFLAGFISQPIINWSSFLLFLILLVSGIALLLLGHAHEKNKPAFLKNPLFILNAPIFLFAELMFALGYREDLKEEMNKITSH